VTLISKRMRVSESHQRSKRQEQESAQRFGGRVSKASGAAYQKGDVRAYKFVRIENKTTKHRSFRVTIDMIDKLEEDAFGADEIPVLEIELELGKKRVFVIPDYAIELLLNVAKKS